MCSTGFGPVSALVLIHQPLRQNRCDAAMGTRCNFRVSIPRLARRDGKRVAHRHRLSGKVIEENREIERVISELA